LSAGASSQRVRAAIARSRLIHRKTRLPPRLRQHGENVGRKARNRQKAADGESRLEREDPLRLGLRLAEAGHADACPSAFRFELDRPLRITRAFTRRGFARRTWLKFP